MKVQCTKAPFPPSNKVRFKHKKINRAMFVQVWYQGEGNNDIHMHVQIGYICGIQYLRYIPNLYVATSYAYSSYNVT